MEGKKNYKVIGLMDTTIDPTNQRVLVAELTEIIYMGITLSNGYKPFKFGTTGKRFVLDFNSNFSKQIINAEKEEDLVEVNFSDFIAKNEFRNGETETIYYHLSINF